VAILLVFGFHLPWGAFRTGSYGVLLFFVLSGYLITTLLLRETDLDGRIDLKRFFVRRARRLLPALIVVSIAHLGLQLLVLGEPAQWWTRTWPALFYVANFVQIGGRSLIHMSHTWSLSIEEHFYLLWPVVLTLIPSHRRFRVALMATIAFTAWRVAALIIGMPGLRISFGTDTNAFALLVGCVLAIGVHEGRFRHLSPVTSTSATAVLIAVSCLPFHYTDRRVLWGAIPVVLLSSICILAAVQAPAFWLENRILRWFGVISYSLYLWHYLLISLPWERWVSVPLLGMAIASIGAAYLTWRLVEAPILGVSNRRPAPSAAGRQMNPVPAD
jgi:peptidoglycan/LPS O-acetylase OafA/YrhL